MESFEMSQDSYIKCNNDGFNSRDVEICQIFVQFQVISNDRTRYWDYFGPADISTDSDSNQVAERGGGGVPSLVNLDQSVQDMTLLSSNKKKMLPLKVWKCDNIWV